MEFYEDFEKRTNLESQENQIAFVLARCDCNSKGCVNCECFSDCESFEIYKIYAREILANCSSDSNSYSKEDILEYEISKFLDSLCYCLSKLCLNFGGQNTKMQIEKKDNDRIFITLPRLFVEAKDVRIGIRFSKAVIVEKDDA